MDWFKYRALGFCGFKDGLFWIVNPDDYDEILDEWIDETAIPEKDAYHVIARSAFGDLFIWGEKTGYKYRLLCNRTWIIEQNGDEKYISKGRSSFAMEVFFGGMDVDSIDLKDSDDNSLFLQYMKKFSPLKSDEVLAFEPTIFLGGEANINTIQKANVFVHLSVLAQFGNLEILDDKALMMKAFN